ncbi:MAG: roadblock/LC7 domain-containing protein, partial [Psychrobacter sp.]
AAAGNSQVVKAKMATMESLGIKGDIDDILITLESQIHIIRPSAHNEGLFLYLVLDKAKSNLALARRKVQGIEGKLEV